MPASVIGLNTGGVQPPYDPDNPSLSNQWTAGSVTAVNPTQLTITAGHTLQFVNGPTIGIANTGTAASNDPVVINGNTTSAGSLEAAYPTAMMILQGADGVSAPVVAMAAFGGQGPGFKLQTSGGTAAAPAAVIAGRPLGSYGFDAYDGAVFSGDAVQIVARAINNWTTADHSASLEIASTPPGSTSIVQAFRVIGGITAFGTVSVASGSNVVQVVGGTTTDVLNVGNAGSFVANGTTAVTVAAAGVTANSVIQTSVRTPGGTVTYPPHISSISAGASFVAIGASLDTSTYSYAIIN